MRLGKSKSSIVEKVNFTEAILDFYFYQYEYDYYNYDEDYDCYNDCIEYEYTDEQIVLDYLPRGSKLSRNIIFAKMINIESTWSVAKRRRKKIDIILDLNRD